MRAPEVFVGRGLLPHLRRQVDCRHCVFGFHFLLRSLYLLLDLSDGRRAQKDRFGGELFPNVNERGSGLVFADFFQNTRETGRKGIVVIDITIGGWT